jgi:hypothetical protein
VTQRVDRASVFSAVADQRREIACLLDVFDEEQLKTPSLCAGWDVKTVAAPGFAALAIAAELARRRAELPTAEIIADFAPTRGSADQPAVVRAS